MILWFQSKRADVGRPFYKIWLKLSVYPRVDSIMIEVKGRVYDLIINYFENILKLKRMCAFMCTY